MENNFKIMLPENPITSEEVIQKNKAMFSTDYEKNGILAKCLAFVHIKQPANAQDITEALQNYYGTHFDKGWVSQKLKRLSELGMLTSTTSGDLMTMSPSLMSEMESSAWGKFMAWLDHIPKQFRKNYTSMVFYWVSNGTGLDYLEWCCRILNFKLEKNDKTNTKSD